MVLAWCGAFLVALWSTLATVHTSGAVPADEFAPAVLVYNALPYLLAVALLLCAWSLRRRRFAGTVLCMAGSLLPPLLIPGVALLAIESARVLLRGETARVALPRPGRILLALTAITALAVTSMFLLGLIESFVYLTRFVPRLVEPDQIAAYRYALAGLSFYSGLQIGVFATLGLAAISAISRGRARLFSLLLGQLGGATLVFIFWQSVGDEFVQIGIAAEIILMGVLLGGLWSGLTWKRVAGCNHADTLDLAEASVRHTLAPPVRFHTAWTMVAGLAVLALLVSMLYPELEDFRAELFDIYVNLAVLLGAVLLLLVVPRRAWLARVVVAAAFAMALTLSGSPRIRIVAREYARAGALATNSWLERLMDPFPRIGMEPADGFAFHGPGEDVLAPDTRPLKNPLIIMLIWDGARPDHCSVHGYDRPTTPNLKRLARESLVFSNAYSNATATTSAVRMLLSGRYSTRFMLAHEYDPFLTKELAAAGYKRFIITVTGNDHNGVSGEAFERNWDTAGVAFDRIVTDHGDDEKPDAPKTQAVIDRISGGDLRNTFIYLHLTGTHYPWFRTSFGDSSKDRYDSETLECDRLLGELLDALEGRDYVLVMTADHGTGLGEHGRLGGFLPYEEQIRVPLLIRVPGMPGRRIEDRVAHIDVAPTLINLLRSGGRHRFHGRSLLPLIAGKQLSPRPVVSFNAFRDAYAIRHGRWKLMHDRGRRYEALFDIEADPEELHNRIADESETALRLRGLLDSFLWQGRRSYGNPYHYRDWDGP